MLTFIIPYLYFYTTRTKGKIKQISYFIIYFMPVLLMYLSFYRSESFFTLLFALVGTFIFYEPGYIVNDCEKTKNELHPTIRITNTDVNIYERNKFMIHAIRLSYIFIYALLAVFLVKNGHQVWMFYVMAGLFFIYNQIHGCTNVFIHLILVILRYLSPFFFFEITAQLVFVVILFFPLIHTIERTREAKFNINNKFTLFFNDANKGRYRYYFIITLLHVPFLLSGSHFVYFSFFINAYFFIYRYLSSRFFKRCFG